MILNSIMPCPLQMAQTFNEINAEVDGLIEFAIEAEKSSAELHASINPHIEGMIEILSGIDYSDDFATSAHAFAIKSAEAFADDPIIDITDDTWAFGDLQKVRTVTQRAQDTIAILQSVDPLWNKVKRGTHLLYDSSPPKYSSFETGGTMTLASHSVQAISEDGTKLVDIITMSIHPENELLTNKSGWFSALLHENFHGLEVMRSLAGVGPSASADRTLFYKEEQIYQKARTLSHRLYEAMPKERLAREVQEKFKQGVIAQRKLRAV
jgi:hypothetical protein